MIRLLEQLEALLSKKAKHALRRFAAKESVVFLNRPLVTAVIVVQSGSLAQTQRGGTLSLADGPRLPRIVLGRSKSRRRSRPGISTQARVLRNERLERETVRLRRAVFPFERAGA